MNKPVSFIAYHGSIEDNLELAPNKAFYLCANYKLAKEFAYREVYGDGLYEGDVPMIYKFKGTFKNPYYLTEEEYDSEGQDSNIDFQKWVDMGVDGIVFQNIQTYYIVIDPSTIRLIGKKYLPFDEEYLERTDDIVNDKDDIIGESLKSKMFESIFDYGIPMIFPDPTYSEFHRIMRDHTTYGKLSAIIDRGHIYCWDSGMAHHHQMIKHIENQMGERLSDNAMWVRFKEPNLAWVSAEYFNDYDDDELDNLETQDFEKELENNPIIKKYFPQGIKLVRFDRIVESREMDKEMINESICFNDMAYNEAFNKFEDLTVWKNPSIDWIKNQLKNIDLRFIYNPDADILYVWDGGKWMHSEVMDTVDMKMSDNVNIIGVFSPGAVEIWAEISPVDDADEAKMLTRKHMGKLLKQIYPFGYQLIAYT